MIEKVHIDPSCFIKELYLNGVNIIEPWGFETADAVSFFTLEWRGYKNEIINDHSSISENKGERNITVKMCEGFWSLNIKEEFVDNMIVREHRLTCLEDSYFMDFVARFRVKKEYISKVLIADRELKFKNSNVYHQFEVNEVKLSGKWFDMFVKILEAETCGRFKPVIYARDCGNEWIIHCRMIPKVWDREVIKLCVGWYNRSIPQWMSDALLLIPPLKKYLWYHGEKRPYGFPMNRLAPNAFPIVQLKAGQELYFKTSLTIE